MARIAHLSDIHFGANDPKIVSAVEAWLLAHRPDLVIISGDFTQRARIEQFRAASAWLNRLRAAGLTLLVIPGNHDIPLYDVVTRFAAPLRRYRKYIERTLCPWFENEEIAVLGLNTARSLTIKDGRINHDQIELMHDRFANVPPHKTRILVTHHPLFAMPIGKGGELSEAVGHHDDAAAAASEAGVHIALAGHFHQTYAESARKMVEKAGSALVIQAGTATSTRLRNAEPQSFNWLHTTRSSEIELQVIVWDGASFQRGDHVRYRCNGGDWGARSNGQWRFRTCRSKRGRTRKVKLSKQAAGQLINTLVLRGYLDRPVNANDRRKPHHHARRTRTCSRLGAVRSAGGDRRIAYPTWVLKTFDACVRDLRESSGSGALPALSGRKKNKMSYLLWKSHDIFVVKSSVRDILISVAQGSCDSGSVYAYQWAYPHGNRRAHHQRGPGLL